MTHIAKPKFHVLDISGNNYQSWKLDIELHLQGEGLAKALVENGKATTRDKANALIFMRRHLHDTLKAQYLTIQDPLTLWTNLKERYDHMKAVILPQAQYAWQHLRLQDFKSVSEYNSALFDIVTQLELCGVTVSEADMLKRTFSTFHASNIVLQQQYRQRNFKKYSELISVLLTAEKTNELLLKNHDLRPTGSAAVPEAHANTNKNSGQFRGNGRRQGRGFRRGGGRSGPNNKNNPRKQNNTLAANHDIGKKPSGKQNDICHRCGLSGLWSRTCRTPKHFVDLYKASLDNDKKKVESHATTLEEEVTNVNNALVMFNEDPHIDIKSLDVSDFFEDPNGEIGHLIGGGVLDPENNN